MEFIRRGREWESIARQAYEIQKKRKELEEKETVLKEQLKILSEDKPSESKYFRFTRIIRKGLVNYGIIPELKSVDLEQYRKEPSISWQLSRY